MAEPVAAHGVSVSGAKSVTVLNRWPWPGTST